MVKSEPTNVLNLIGANWFAIILFLQPTNSRAPTVPFQQLSLYQVFARIIQAIWRISHYQIIFEDTPFVPLAVLHRITASDQILPQTGSSFYKPNFDKNHSGQQPKNQ
ncbi:hypothetical protein MAM1_0266d08934 [Mucor ambiguus]|uniref:Uncharacterized protein n=1 Tax=Mucor ambiguus TaxID=91626 RepID=A0A0C9N0H6_9FUNG|nr:hypothetical protein MAM1_0266d08934 [Mucor ambiguus]